VLLHDLGQWEEARRAYLAVLQPAGERHFTSVDRGLGGFKARQNLAVLAADRGDLAESERWWREVVREVPGYRPGWRGLGETLLGAGRLATAEALAEELKRDATLRIEGMLLEGRLALARGGTTEALAAVDRAVSECPTDAEALRQRRRLVPESGVPRSSEA
jgi:tetratricopeptide (TPR) repeat protein